MTVCIHAIMTIITVFAVVTIASVFAINAIAVVVTVFAARHVNTVDDNACVWQFSFGCQLVEQAEA